MVLMPENKSFALSCWESRVWCTVYKVTFRWEKPSLTSTSLGSRKLAFSSAAACKSQRTKVETQLQCCVHVTCTVSLWTRSSDNWISAPCSVWSQLTNSPWWEDWDHCLTTAQRKGGKLDVLDKNTAASSLNRQRGRLHWCTQEVGFCSLHLTWTSCLLQIMIVPGPLKTSAHIAQS